MTAQLQGDLKKLGLEGPALLKRQHEILMEWVKQDPSLLED
jgi:hypothetical protein